MAGRNPPLPKPAEPRHGRVFDPWNSVGAGHQRAETRGPQGWREARSRMLDGQFRGGWGRDQGGLDGDGTCGPAAPRNVMDMLRNPGSMKTSIEALPRQEREKEAAQGEDSAMLVDDTRELLGKNSYGYPEGKTRDKAPTADETEAGTERRQQPGRIFDGLVVYVNGSTHPVVSDHRLKHLLAAHGARTAIHLGRRQVTHVIVGRPSVAAASSSSSSSFPSSALGGVRGGKGAGGGLAGGKLQKEIRRVGGCGIKYVDAEWVLESLKAGRRLPEARFAHLSVAPGGQASVLGAFSKPPPPSSTSSSVRP